MEPGSTVRRGEIWRRWMPDPAEHLSVSLESIAETPARRDVLAGMCLQGMLANAYTNPIDADADLAADAVAMADALIAELDDDDDGAVSRCRVNPPYEPHTRTSEEAAEYRVANGKETDHA